MTDLRESQVKVHTRETSGTGGGECLVTVSVICRHHEILGVTVWDSAGGVLQSWGSGPAMDPRLSRATVTTAAKPGDTMTLKWGFPDNSDPFPITVDVHEAAGPLHGVLSREEMMGHSSEETEGPDSHRHGPFLRNGKSAPTKRVPHPQPDHDIPIEGRSITDGPGPYTPP